MKHKVTIEETLRLTVEVEAGSPALAVCQVEDDYNAEVHVLSAEQFVGADIFLSNDDEVAKAALQNTEFIAFVEECFKNMGDDIPIDNKIKTAFGSMDNALYEFKEHKDKLQKADLQYLYILNTCDAWHSHLSMEPIGYFSSFENLVNHIRVNQERFNLSDEEVEEFEIHEQTQGREVNYYCDRVILNP